MHEKVSMVRGALATYAAGDTACEHRIEGQSCGACEACESEQALLEMVRRANPSGR